jgi:hypothetical protein
MEAYTLDDFKAAMRQVQASCSDAGKKRKAGDDAPKPPKGVVLYAFNEAAEVENELEMAGLHMRRRLKDANTLSMLECTVGSVGKTGGEQRHRAKDLTVAVKFVTSHAFGLRAFCDNFMWLYGGGLEYKGDGVGSVMTQAFLQLMIKDRKTLVGDDRVAIAARQCYKCATCDKFLATFEIDHILPLVSGGSNADSNLQALCKVCHSEKTSTEARSRGNVRGVQSHVSPAVWDVFHNTPKPREVSWGVGQEVRAIMPGDNEVVGQAIDIDSAGRLLIAVPGENTLYAVGAGDIVHLRHN